MVKISIFELESYFYVIKVLFDADYDKKQVKFSQIDFDQFLAI